MKNDNQFHPLGIWQRLFNFISRFISPSMSSAAPDSAEIAVMNGVDSTDEPHKPKTPSKSGQEETVSHQDQKMPKDDDSGSRIEIHFKQTEEDLDYWTPIDKLGSSVHVDHHDEISSSLSEIVPVKDKAKEIKKSKVAEPLPDKDKAKEKKSKIAKPPQKELPLVQVNDISLQQGTKRADSTTQGTGFQETPRVAQGRGTHEIVSTDHKGKNKASDQIVVPIQDKEPKPRNQEHILSANINQKSEVFLSSRKEAMRRTLS